MMFPKQGKRKARGHIIEDVDRAFSQFVRLTYAGPGGLVRCFTCPTTGNWKEFDAGHFVDRRHFVLRWDKRNVKPQCQGCNRYADGNIERFAAALDREMGLGTANELREMAEKAAYMGHSRVELAKLARYYREQARNLKLYLGA